MVPPKNTPLKLSYVWKNIEKLTKKMIEWKFSREEADKYIEIVSQRIKAQPSKTKNMQVALREEMLQYCYKQLTERKEAEDDLILKISKSHQYLKSVSNGDIARHLMSRHKPGALPNIVLYYQRSILCKQYLAFSDECKKVLSAMMSMNPSERSFLPTDANLQYISMYQYKSKSTQIKSILRK